MKNGASLNYETANQYLLPVVASDGMLITTSTLTLSICDINEAPSVTNLPTTISLSKDTFGRALLIKLFVQDQDVNDNHTFTILSTNPTNQLNNFTIDSSK